MPKKSSVSWLSSHRTHSHQQGVPWEARHEAHKTTAGPLICPPAVCVSAQLLNRWWSPPAFTWPSPTWTERTLTWERYSYTLVQHSTPSFLGIPLGGCVFCVRTPHSATRPWTFPPAPRVLSPLLFTLMPYDCAAIHSSNHIIKFADGTAVMRLIRGKDEVAYREEVQQLMNWYKTNSLSLNVEKTKEMVVDFKSDVWYYHSPLNNQWLDIINSSTKSFGVHNMEYLTGIQGTPRRPGSLPSSPHTDLHSFSWSVYTLLCLFCPVCMYVAFMVFLFLYWSWRNVKCVSGWTSNKPTWLTQLANTESIWKTNWFCIDWSMSSKTSKKIF